MFDFNFKKIDGKPDRYNEDWTINYSWKYEFHGIEMTWWDKLDCDLYNFSLKLPQPLGFLFRFLMAILGSNHRHPMPMSKQEDVAYLWWDKPNWVRYLLWHYYRNPWADLRKLYLGFGWAFYADKVWYIPLITTKRIRFWIKAPWKIPLFPHFEWDNGTWEFDIGFKDRGIFSLSFRRS